MVMRVDEPPELEPYPTELWRKCRRWTCPQEGPCKCEELRKP